jgi:Skp family chaperone for outer membrane proteins
MRRDRLSAALALVLLAVGLLAPAARAEEDPGPPYVDLQKVLTEFRRTPAFSKFQAKIRDQYEVLNEEMKILALLRYCTEAERNEAIAIKNKKEPTPQEKARFDELAKKADQVDNELAALSRKTTPTDADRKRMAQLSQLRTEGVRYLSKQDTDRRERLRKIESDVMTEVENELLKLVQAVAREYKLPAIYERRAVLVGGVDLTVLVLKKLPRAP